MKKYIVIGLMALTGASCSDSFLEEEMVSTITQDYFDTEQGLDDLIVSTYNSLRWKYAWMEGPYNYEMGTDLSLVGNAGWDNFTPSTWSPTGAAGNTYGNDVLGYYSRTLLGAYPTINNCNRAIEAISEGRAQGRYAIDEDYARLRMSEALFNRAWNYYMVNTLFGDCYMTLRSNNSVPANYNFVKSTSEDIYKQIIGDLRYCYDNLPLPAETTRGRLTKWAAAHFLAKLYLYRAQGAQYKQYRNADGTIDPNNSNAYLGMLYKGEVTTDLDSCIYYSSQVINNGGYQLEADYRNLWNCKVGDYSNEDSKEIILQASFGTTNNNDYNTRYNMRFHGYFTTVYVQALWGIPNYTWDYGNRNTGFRPTDWAYDVFTDKMADSRFEKTFRVEYMAALSTSATGTNEANEDYYAYNSPSNTTQTWLADDAAYFNEYIRPTYDRASWGGRLAVEGEHKIGTGDLGLVFLENTKETAITLKEAKAQPYVLYPRWIYDEDNNKYYYRRVGEDRYAATNQALGNAYNQWCGNYKHVDPNRATVTSESGTRDVPIFRLAETYLLRAEAYGRKEGANSGNAIADINAVRIRAAYKAGETRAEVMARLYPGHTNLTQNERSYPYNVEVDKMNEMRIDASYWDGVSEHSIAENYPQSATSDLQRFIHFIYNEYSREFNSELVLYSGIHHAGIQAERIQWHHQMGSTLQNHWPVSDNVTGKNGQDGNGHGTFRPAYTLKPWPQTFIDMLTDENNQPLSEESKKAYQNPGY